MKKTELAAAIAFGLTATAHADQVFTDDVIVEGALLCVGTACQDGEALIPSRQGVKVKGLATAILFQDTSTSSNDPTTDWQLSANEPSRFDEEGFIIEDRTANTKPVFISGGAPNNALKIDTDGDVAFGTAFPLDKLHITSTSSFAGIRLEKTGANDVAWRTTVGNLGYQVSDATNNTVPFGISNTAPSFSTFIDPAGSVGMGLQAPEGKLHTKGDGTQLIYFESGDGGAVQMRFRSDSQNRRFLAVNNSNQVQTQMQFRDNEILFLGATTSQEWLRVNAMGITTAGPTCNPNPCDRTFDPEHFTVPAIEDRAAFMWENMHLPAVGPTAPGKPFNLTEKTAGMLHELEVAHIYIEQLHTRQEHQTQQLSDAQARDAQQQAQIDMLMARLATLETQAQTD